MSPNNFRPASAGRKTGPGRSWERATVAEVSRRIRQVASPVAPVKRCSILVNGVRCEYRLDGLAQVDELWTNPGAAALRESRHQEHLYREYQARKGGPERPSPIQAGGLSVVERARRYVEKMEPAISGSGGHRQAFLVASVVRRGFQLDDEQAISILREWNERCEPPWSEKELAHKLRSALKHGRMDLGLLLERGRR